ncbi:MAG TPA: alpha/beta family hydrolase [Gemmatimonadales bacterium]|nr:alpha/beta family hydrolase [Gemmatimonadales bacterium]
MSEPLRIAVGDATVSGLLDLPADARWLYVCAHGAGAGMRHVFLEHLAATLGAHGIAMLRYNFLYMEVGKGRVDPPALAHAAVRAAVAAARAHGVPLLAGGKSFGGRMTSQAQAAEPLPGVRGLAFFGFPLHPPGKPDTARADHLDQVRIPSLFLQGTRDEFAQLDLLQAVTQRLGARATLHLIEGGDHSFKVKKSSGKTEQDVLSELAGVLRSWADAL